MKIGVIASSGGSVIQEIYRILRENNENIDFIVVTDRPCGIEDFCERKNIAWTRIIEKDQELFSQKANQFFLDNGGVTFILLFFLRLIGKSVFQNYATFNIHPSILPAFKGFNPIEKAVKNSAKFFGATIHLVDSSVDGGKIVGQIISPLIDKDMEILNKTSFLHKVYLTLVIIELIQNESIIINLKHCDYEWQKIPSYNYMANPALVKQEYINSFNFLLEKEGINFFKL